MDNKVSLVTPKKLKGRPAFPIGYKFPTKRELQQRADEVLDLLLKGHRRGEIVEMLSLKWGVSQRTVDKAIARCNETFKKMAEISKIEHFNTALGQLQTLYRESMQQKDYNTALKVRMELNKLLGLSTQHIDLTVRSTVQISFDGFDADAESNITDIDHEEVTN